VGWVARSRWVVGNTRVSAGTGKAEPQADRNKDTMLDS
jgi:hypothetical protein